MESLFGPAEPQEKSFNLFPEEKKSEAAERPEEKESQPSGKKPASHKGFADSLDAFLAEAFEAMEEGESESKSGRSNRGRRAGSGLDLLIQSTTNKTEFIPQQHDSRRVTLVFNKKHLEQLKKVARKRNVYLKDVIGEIVEQYLSRQKKKD